MLVLTRQEGQSLKIGNGIIVKVLKLRNNDVSIGIQAPRDVEILRGELLEWDEQMTQELKPKPAI